MFHARWIPFVVCSCMFFKVLTPELLADKPNVVIILADDLGWGAVSNHADWAETPNIDRLISAGVELDRFYVAPMCSPTRAGLLTGRYPIRYGLARAVIPPQRNFGLPVEEQTLADALSKAGYTNRGIFGKWHLGHHHIKWHPLSRGFTHFEGHYNGAIDYFDLTREGERDWHINFQPSPKQGYATDLIAEAAVQFISTAAQEQAPFFCYIPFNAPHSPFQAKPEDLARYSTRSDASKEDTLRAMIWCLDQAVGRVLQAIEDCGEADNTQVWFLSDNGGVPDFKQNNVPLRGAKLTTFEGGVRVPAGVRWPARWRGSRRLTNTMGYIDVMPTILESAGVNLATIQPEDKPLDGVSLCSLLDGTESALAQRDWYSYHGQSGPDRETIAVTTSQWKLIVNGPDIRDRRIGDEHRVFLFKMPVDLLEQNDVAEQHPQVVEELFIKLQAYRSLQPANGVGAFGEGRQGFKPWKDWRIDAPH